MKASSAPKAAARWRAIARRNASPTTPAVPAGRGGRGARPRAGGGGRGGGHRAQDRVADDAGGAGGGAAQEVPLTCGGGVVGRGGGRHGRVDGPRGDRRSRSAAVQGHAARQRERGVGARVAGLL